MSPEHQPNQSSPEKQELVLPLTPEDLLPKTIELKPVYQLSSEEIQTANEQLRKSFNGTSGEIHLPTTYSNIVEAYGPHWTVTTPDQNDLNSGTFFLARRQKEK